MRSSTVAFAVTLALANSASVLAAGGSAATITYASPTILQTGDSEDISISSTTASVDATSTSLSALVPITSVTSVPESSTLSAYESSFTSYSINFISSHKPSGSVYSSGSVSSSIVSGKPGVYSNSTIISTATASVSSAGTSTATAVTEVPGATKSSSKSGAATSASSSASASSSSSAAGALSMNGASWSVGSLMLGGMAVVFGFF
ncbi:hypothetical protein BTUL_0002g00790 [Botrytis tulipae]|uniref:REJ domain-containing protein n=1 Tax=Botrytis tulipae TaxID=87230 RepID=A0A4Z1F555_9HELO|nr:hypothetical protein BTUL_0002g00790 [Botrytis tulipae]